MIITKLSGGLGNQMFQYAAGLAVANRTGAELALDLSWYRRKAQRGVRTRRGYELDVFRQPSQSRRTSAESTIATLRESSFEFDPSVIQVADPVSLEGHWQSERYFDDCPELVRSAFELRRCPSRRAQSLCALLQSRESIAIHVRRGDYSADATTRATHGLVPLQHYVDSVERILPYVDDPIAVVFTDDRAWCAEHLRLPVRTVFGSRRSGRRGWEDLFVMTKAKHHVIANSTFSWWAAWLGRKPGQYVIPPPAWFADPNINTSTLFPNWWVTPQNLSPADSNMGFVS